MMKLFVGGFTLFRRLVLRSLYIKVANLICGCLIRNPISLLLSLAGLSYHKYKFLDQISPSVLIEKNSECISTPPDYDDSSIITSIVPVPSICIYLLQGVIGNVQSSNFIMGNKLILERIPHIPMEYSNYATGLVKAHDDKGALVKNPDGNIVNIEKAIFLGGNGSWNYYHWMTEILPKIEILIKANVFNECKTIIVSSLVAEIDAFYETLSYSLRGIDVKIEYIDAKSSFKVEKLYVVNSPCNILFNSKKKFTDVRYNFYRKSSLDWVRGLVLNSLNEKILLSTLNASQLSVSRVFIARKYGRDRSYNQDEIEDFLISQYGFKAIFIEDYTVEQQAFIFNNAEIIVGPSGAAWTNMIFCKKATVALSWLPENLSEFSAFSTIATFYGVRMKFVHACSRDNNSFHANYTVNVNAIKKMIDSMIDKC